MGTIYHVAILVLQLKPQYHILEIAIMSRGKGQAPLRSRHSSKCLRTAHSGQPLYPPRPVHTYVSGLAIPEHTFPGPYRPKIEAPRIPTTTQVKII